MISPFLLYHTQTVREKMYSIRHVWDRWLKRSLCLAPMFHLGLYILLFPRKFYKERRLIWAKLDLFIGGEIILNRDC